MASAPRSPPRFPVTLVRLVTKKLNVDPVGLVVPLSFLLQEAAIITAAEIARREMHFLMDLPSAARLAV